MTQRIEIIAAIKPPLYHPVVLAKMAQQIEHISGGRFAINLVNAWNRPEYEKAGIPFAPHDERYAYGRNGSRSSSLAARRTGQFRRELFHRCGTINCARPIPFRARPAIYVGGESAPAQDLVSALWRCMVHQRPTLSEVARLIASCTVPAAAGAPLRFGLSAFVIARDSAAQAERPTPSSFRLPRTMRHPRPSGRQYRSRRGDETHHAAQTPRIGTNGGTAAGLVGSYDEVAERIRAFHAAGIELFMLQFQPFEAEMRRFAKEIFPRVKG